MKVILTQPRQPAVVSFLTFSSLLRRLGTPAFPRERAVVTEGRRWHEAFSCRCTEHGSREERLLWGRREAGRPPAAEAGLAVFSPDGDYASTVTTHRVKTR